MNFSLTEEQEFLQEAARGALGRVKTVEAARDALEGSELPDLWPAAVEAGWPGLLISEANEGAGLEPIDAMLVMVEVGKVLAAVPLLGHLPATYVLDRAGADTGLLERARRGRQARLLRGRGAAVEHQAGVDGVRRSGSPTRRARTSSSSSTPTGRSRCTTAPRSRPSRATTRPGRSAT